MKFLKKLLCRFKGHDYPGWVFESNHLYFCRRCGREFCNRTFYDLAMPSDYDDDCPTAESEYSDF